MFAQENRHRNFSTTQNFVRIAQGACQYCITSEVMHIDFLLLLLLLFVYITDGATAMVGSAVIGMFIKYV